MSSWGATWEFKWETKYTHTTHTQQQQWWRKAVSHVHLYRIQQKQEFCFILFQDFPQNGIEGDSQDVIHVFQFIWLNWSAFQTERETFSHAFPPSSPFCCFFFCSPFSFFFYSGGRLARLSMAHICSSSLWYSPLFWAYCHPDWWTER